MPSRRRAGPRNGEHPRASRSPEFRGCPPASARRADNRSSTCRRRGAAAWTQPPSRGTAGFQYLPRELCPSLKSSTGGKGPNRPGHTCSALQTATANSSPTLEREKPVRHQIIGVLGEIQPDELDGCQIEDDEQPSDGFGVP